MIRCSVTRASAVALALAANACALTYDATRLGAPTSLAEAAQAPATGTPFRVTKHPVYLLFGLVPVSQPNLEDVLAGQLGKGASIAGLRIKERSRWGDLLVTVLTLGVIVPRSVTYEGVVLTK